MMGLYLGNYSIIHNWKECEITTIISLPLKSKTKINLSVLAFFFSKSDNQFVVMFQKLPKRFVQLTLLERYTVSMQQHSSHLQSQLVYMGKALENDNSRQKDTFPAIVSLTLFKDLHKALVFSF